MHRKNDFDIVQAYFYGGLHEIENVRRRTAGIKTTDLPVKLMMTLDARKQAKEMGLAEYENYGPTIRGFYQAEMLGNFATDSAWQNIEDRLLIAYTEREIRPIKKRAFYVGIATGGIITALVLLFISLFL